jgi:type II secretory pathway pseudopilin PulG
VSLARLRRRLSLRAEDGFSLAELVIAILVMIMGVGALTALFVNNDNSSLAGQREVSQLAVLQQQIENIHQLVKQYGFGALAMSGNPAQPTDATLPGDPTDPNDFVTGWGTSSEAFKVESDYNNTGNGTAAHTPSAGEPLLDPINGVSGGQVAPVQYADLSNGTTYANLASVPAGDSYATVYSYVMGTTTAGCNSSGLGSSCPASDVRRVVVAVLLNQPAHRQNVGPNTPTYSTTVVSNPIPTNQPSATSGLCILALGC